MDVDGLAEVLPQRTLVEWIEFYKQNPFGDDWAQAATIAAAAMNPHIKRPVNPEKLIPRARKRRQTPEELAAAMSQMQKKTRGQ